ncbi:MAG TPA: hypothetical protein PL041_00350 [Melioribacteraceae bacterium]|nr:hypothetical protein [Melioribacteraceae bacterium]
MNLSIKLFTLFIIFRFVGIFAQSNNYLFLTDEDLKYGMHNVKHYETFSKYCTGYNLDVLKAIDIVQLSDTTGGGYFVGVKANPPESPIGYNLCLLGNKLLEAPRKTSYCSGASYSVFIEALNLIFKESNQILPDSVIEFMRMQEKDGSRREDDIKYWGKWNTDGYGNQIALVQYSGMGKQVCAKDALPGDFVNISWKNGNGHSTVFLGWYINAENDTNIVYFSSQKATNGLGDQIVNINSIDEVVFVRLTEPEKLFTGKFNENVVNKIKGEIIFRGNK